jgi:hypothetical protein
MAVRCRFLCWPLRLSEFPWGVRYCDPCSDPWNQTSRLQKLGKTRDIVNVLCLKNLVFFSYVIFETTESEVATYIARFSVIVTES